MKLKTITILSIFLLASLSGISQKYFTRTAEVTFFSEAPTENIEAENRQVTCILNTENGEIAFSVQMKGFHFEKALMEEHFNENYVESHKYPKSTFKGKILEYDKINIKKDGKYKVTVEGELLLHGVAKKIKAEGEISRLGDQIMMTSKFDLKVEDYKISIPKAVIKKIAESIEVSMEATLNEYKK